MSYQIFLCLTNTKTCVCTIRRHLRVGDKAHLERLITKEDIQQFGNLSGDWNPIHFEKDGKRSIVHGALLNGFVSAALGTKLPGPGTILVEQYLRYPNPCYEGDRIQITIEIVSVKRIVECKFVCAVEDRVVLRGLAKVILPRRNNSSGDNC